MIYKQPDLDCDISQKSIDEIKKCMKNIPASIITSTNIKAHNSGVYFCDAPVDLISGLCSINYKEAESDFGLMKVDLLHNTMLDKFNTRTELFNILKKPIQWNLLKNEEVVERLPHISAYFNLIQEMPNIDSIEKLAMFIACIRPGKKNLIQKIKENGWDSVKNSIWEPTKEYYYKKSHAISYAMMISIGLR